MYRRLLLVLLCALPLVATAHGPSRQKVTKDIKINAPAAKVWSIIADFCAISTWHPGVVKCEGTGGNEVGAKRVLVVGKEDGPRIEEELQLYDAEKMTYKYRITKTDVSVLPVATYSAFIGVVDNGDGTSTASWKGGFYRSWGKNDPPPEQSDEAALKAVTGTYEAGLANIKKLAEQ
ncbi:MAG: SRPBCC family protein [Gemmatimonadaceae bacterium]|jgi:carbon monoxide dehydrogenase subunit G|nr:SRPBCC family protein [Gemmatimonadaceae bacterium]